MCCRSSVVITVAIDALVAMACLNTCCAGWWIVTVLLLQMVLYVIQQTVFSRAGQGFLAACG
jgi:hypothetical protein